MHKKYLLNPNSKFKMNKVGSNLGQVDTIIEFRSS